MVGVGDSIPWWLWSSERLCCECFWPINLKRPCRNCQRNLNTAVALDIFLLMSFNLDGQDLVELLDKDVLATEGNF